MSEQTLQILGVTINSTSTNSVLKLVRKKIEKREKFWIVTPNPEFIVVCQKDLEFKKILNSADLAIPDGFGLVLASKFLRTKPQLVSRVAGSDIVGKILEEATGGDWKIGIIGARRGEVAEIRKLIRNLESRYSGLRVEAFELDKNWQKGRFDIIFACQGMKKQEKWIWENFPNTQATLFMGIGGSLDFLAGFSRRAPRILRNLGLEWLWRMIQKPHHLKRIFAACVVFPLLIFRERFRNTKTA